MKSLNPKPKLLSAVMLAAIYSLGLAVPAQACSNNLRTGMFGVARGQVARINVAYVCYPDGRSIQVDMGFFDAMGQVVGRDMKTLMPGQATFFDVFFDTFSAENRIELRAIARAVGNPDGKNLEITVEVFDNDTGKNTVFIGNPDGS